MIKPTLIDRIKGLVVPGKLTSSSVNTLPSDDLPTDTLQPMKIGLWGLGIFFGGFLLWAALAPLDEGVPAHGQVSIDTKRKTVQHLTGGIVKQVFVKEGQFVKADEPLLRLDDATALANYETVRQYYLTLRAMEGRLMAEQGGLEKIAFHEDLLPAESDPVIKQITDNQQQLFRSRRMALKSELQAVEEMIQGQEAAIRGFEGMLTSRKNQQSLLQEEMKGVRELVAEGYAPRNKLLELERASSELLGSVADLQANIQRSKNTISELRMRRSHRIQEYQKEVSAQLSEVQRDVQSNAEKYRAIRNDLERMVIRAPVEGQVVGLAVQSVSGVIVPGQKILDVVPGNEPLLLEVRVPPNFKDRVKAGTDADARFSSFAHSPTLVVKARVESISSDLLSDPQNNFSYYLARVSITPQGMKALGKNRLEPGMPAEVVFKTGQRSVLTYLLHPLMKRLAAAMKEE